MKHHLDGTPCREGTRKLPRHHTPCCHVFGAHLDTCALDLRYEWWSKQRFWVIAIPESAGAGGVWISHCPHCGKRLRPASTQRPRARDTAGQAGRWLAT